MNNWMTTCDNDNCGLVISSRIRLARNLAKIPFSHKLTVQKSKEVIELVENAFYTSSDTKEKFTTNYLWEKSDNDKNIYLEKHLISKNLIDNSSKSAFILDDQETISIMINEEDHVRIQCITGGLNLEEVYDLSEKMDDLLEENLQYAFDEKLGYLTACPTNVGTGLRASVMLHLPALSLNNQLNGLLNALAQVGMTIRGLYGEGSKAIGNIYQISNQVTLGRNEEEILSNLKALVLQIISQERISRENLMKKYKYELEDKIYRALGVLKSAVLLNSTECLKLLSDVRLGVEMGIIKNVDKITLNKLLVEVQPATIQKEYKECLSNKDRDFNRAKFVREKLAVNTA